MSRVPELWPSAASPVCSNQDAVVTDTCICPGTAGLQENVCLPLPGQHHLPGLPPQLQGCSKCGGRQQSRGHHPLPTSLLTGTHHSTLFPPPSASSQLFIPFLQFATILFLSAVPALRGMQM